MAYHWDSESALSWTGAIVIAVVATLSLSLLVSNQGWIPENVLVAAFFVAHLCTYASQAFVDRWQERPRLRQTLFWFEALLIVGLYVQVSNAFIAILGIVWIVQAGEIFKLRTTIWLLALAVATFAATHMLHWQDDILAGLGSALTLGLFHVFAVVVTQRFRRERVLREETAALNRELLATRELLSQQSRQNERLRIARDLHDLLGHHMTALILQLEVATHMTEEPGRIKVEQALALAKLLLSDLRTAVSELRDDDAIELQQAVEKLVNDLPDLDIHLDFASAPVVKEVDVAETLLRCTQEALTNVLRHSNATRCDIALTQYYNQYFLTVQDNGQSSQTISAGNGLKGMRERARERGGEVNWGQQEDGFLLQVQLPVEAQP